MGESWLWGQRRNILYHKQVMEDVCNKCWDAAILIFQYSPLSVEICPSKWLIFLLFGMSSIHFSMVIMSENAKDNGNRSSFRLMLFPGGIAPE